MSEEKELELEYYSTTDSSLEDEAPDYAGAEPVYVSGYTQSSGKELGELRWNDCKTVLEDEESEAVEFLLDHDENSAVMFQGVSADELEEKYSDQKYQVMGRRGNIPEKEEYEWEPIRDLSGPTDAEKAAANLVAGIGVAGFTTTEAVFKAAFGIVSAAAR